jgi:methionyl-tRNA synthetase
MESRRRSLAGFSFLSYNNVSAVPEVRICPEGKDFAAHHMQSMESLCEKRLIRMNNYCRGEFMCKNCKGKYYITSAIAYASGKPHIGNTYEIVLADAIARYKRQEGYDVYFQTGTDEHGQKNELKAEEAGVTPKEYVDQMSAEIKRIWDLMNTSYDNFIRTTDEDHKIQVQKIFKRLYDQGDIYKGAYEGWYCTPCESFWTETQLVDGKCPDCGREVQMAKEEAYFFKMSKYADRLEQYIDEHPEFIQPASRKNEMINNFIKPGLQDLCVSRTSFSWGIPVDFDPKHVVYVWLDALTNYITKIGYDADGNSSDLFNKFWPADLHLIGKDIIRFHTIYWPIFLMALDLPLPKQVFGHPWLVMSNGKMSKSKGNVIYADDLAEIFGVDAVRYFLLHEMPYENDGVISWELMVERTNSDLANTIGNLVNRTISMSNKYFGGVVADKGVTEAVDEDLKQAVTGTRDRVAAKMADLRVADAMTEVLNLFKRCNKYIDETEPWVLAKEEEKKDRLSTVLYNLIESINIGAVLIRSFMPETADKIIAQINGRDREFEELNQFGLYESGRSVTAQPEILFARKDLKEVMAKVEELMPAQQKEEPQEAEKEGIDIEAKPEITFDDFTKMQFQVGEIIKCEEVPKSKKLLCSQVRIGSEVKQIVSGIKKYYSAEEMVGKKVMVLVNLKPAKLAGVLSEGMLLCAEDAEGNLSLMTPEKPMPSGAEIA